MLQAIGVGDAQNHTRVTATESISVPESFEVALFTVRQSEKVHPRPRVSQAFGLRVVVMSLTEMAGYGLNPFAREFDTHDGFTSQVRADLAVFLPAQQKAGDANTPLKSSLFL